MGKERKAFFFEKKNQKTFIRSGQHGGLRLISVPAAKGESFLLLFFKKEALGFLPSVCLP